MAEASGSMVDSEVVEPYSPREHEDISCVEPLMGPFLGEQREQDKGKKTLVLDLDETLVHSTFQEVTNCQYVIPVVIANNTYNVYVYLRPGAIEFINRMSQLYEVVIYTASMNIVRIPLLCHV